MEYTPQETNKENSEPHCLSCQVLLLREHYVRDPGMPVTYTPVFYCDNSECPRYGLLSIYKLKVEN